MTPLKSISTAIVAVVALAASTSAATAATIRVDGQVIAPPTAHGKRTSVPLLLTTRAERKLKLRRGIVRVLVARRARLSAPAPSGRGSVRIAPSALRVGDRVRAVAKLSRKRVRRLRKRSVPAFAVRRARVSARAAALSNDDLARMIAGLDARLTALSRRVDELAASNAVQLGALRANFDGLAARTAALESGFATLGGSLSALLARVDALEGLVDPELLTGLQGDVGSLLARVGSLEGVTGGLDTSLAALNGTVGALQSSLTGVQDDLTPLLTTVDSLSGRLDVADVVLAEVPGLLTQVDGIESSLTTLTGQVDANELLLGSLDTTVGGLETSVGELTATTDGLLVATTGQGSAIAALQGDVSTLTTDLGTVTTGLSDLQGTVTALGATVTGLGANVTTLTGQVTGLAGTIDLICGVPAIDLVIDCP